MQTHYVSTQLIPIITHTVASKQKAEELYKKIAAGPDKTKIAMLMALLGSAIMELEGLLESAEERELISTVPN